MIILVDDGTLDTVLECDVCTERMRYNFAATDPRDVDPYEDVSYAGFVDWAAEDARFSHNCPAEVN